MPSESTLRAWLREAEEERDRYRGPPGAFTPSPTKPSGRKCAIPDEIRDDIIKCIDDLADRGESPTKAGLFAVVRRKLRDNGLSPSQSTIMRFIKSLNLVERRADTTTKPRRDAEADPRNSISLAAALGALRGGVEFSPKYSFNFDASAFWIISKNDKAERSTVMVTKDWISRNGKVRLTADSSDRVGVTIFAGGNANGNRLPAVTVVVDKGARAVRSFYSPHAPCPGYDGRPGMFIVTPNRQAPEVGPMVVRHFINEVAEFCKKDPPPENHAVELFFDGADENLKCTKDDDVLAQCKQAGVVLVKLPAGLAHKFQPMDVSPCFRLGKDRLQRILDDEAAHGKTVMETHKERAQDVRGALSAVAAFRGAELEKWTGAVMRVGLACNDAITDRHLMNGFSNAGIHPFSTSRLVLACAAEYPELRRLDADKLVAGLADVVLEKGIIEESDFDAAGVPKTPLQAEQEANARRTDLNERALRSQRTVFINSEAYLEHERKRREAAAAEKAAKVAEQLAKRQRREAAAASAAQRKEAAEDEKRRQDEYDQHDGDADGGDECSVCLNVRQRAAEHGFSDVYGQLLTTWTRCSACGFIWCPRCRNSNGKAVIAKHKKRCAAKATRARQKAAKTKRPAPATFSSASSSSSARGASSTTPKRTRRME